MDNNQKWREEYERQQREEKAQAQANIPKWIERGKAIIPPEKHADWEKCVRARANDLYNGLDLEDALKIMEALEAGASMDQAAKMFEDQNHSGFSASMVRKILYHFSSRGQEFWDATAIGEVAKENREKTETKKPEREYKARPGDTLESVVNDLLAFKAKGERRYCTFNGHTLHSDNVTMDSAFLEVLGCTKAEHDRKLKEWREQYEQEEIAREAREKGYKEKVAATRTGEKKPITMSQVIKGLTFIAENQQLTQEELIEGLLELGCNFTLEDIQEQFPEPGLLFEGMKKCEVSCGASVIANVRDSEFGRAYCDDRFLSLDDDTSIYHFVRTVTGDQGYTKEYVDSINAEKHK